MLQLHCEGERCVFVRSRSEVCEQLLALASGHSLERVAPLPLLDGLQQRTPRLVAQRCRPVADEMCARLAVVEYAVGPYALQLVEQLLVGAVLAGSEAAAQSGQIHRMWHALVVVRDVGSDAHWTAEQIRAVLAQQPSQQPLRASQVDERTAQTRLQRGQNRRRRHGRAGRSLHRSAHGEEASGCDLSGAGACVAAGLQTSTASQRGGARERQALPGDPPEGTAEEEVRTS